MVDLIIRDAGTRNQIVVMRQMPEEQALELVAEWIFSGALDEDYTAVEIVRCEQPVALGAAS
jgi:hypothetical protein